MPTKAIFFIDKWQLRVIILVQFFSGIKFCRSANPGWICKRKKEVERRRYDSMMNKFIFLFLVLMGGFATNASADPLYFTADKVTFGDIAENASYESDFGLYSLADPSNMYKVFSYKKEPGANKTVTISNWGELDDGFGFWFGVHTGGLSDSTADYFWFSDPLLNRYAGGGSIDTSLNHLKVAFTPASGILVSLDDQLGGSASDNDFDDMVVFGKGCNIESLPPTAPVPEPATMLLFGAGLIGLAGGSRRKK